VDHILPSQRSRGRFKLSLPVETSESAKFKFGGATHHHNPWSCDSSYHSLIRNMNMIWLLLAIYCRWFAADSLADRDKLRVPFHLKLQVACKNGKFSRSQRDLAGNLCVCSCGLSLRLECQLNTYFNRGRGEALACFLWHLPVRCLPPAFRYRFYHINSTFRFSVGNSSLLWISSGVSSEGIVPTVGQYGSVLTGSL
jgi:hypothetical protein